MLWRRKDQDHREVRTRWENELQLDEKEGRDIDGVYSSSWGGMGLRPACLVLSMHWIMDAPREETLDKLQREATP